MKLLCGCEGAHVVQARLSGEAPEKEGMASDCLKGPGGWGGREGLRKRAFSHPPAAERSLCLETVAAASPVTVEPMDQARLSSQDQFTAG